jgi:hypothetical protein
LTFTDSEDTRDQDPLGKNWSHNEWAKYWRERIGVETLPANSRSKIPFVPGKLESWLKYQTEPSTDKEFQHWLDNNAFDNGICILTGKIRHRPDRNHLYFVVIDVDRPDGIKELFTRNGSDPPPLQEIAKKWIVTQHKDSLEKAHFGFYSSIPFAEKSSDSIIGLEVRCQDYEGKTRRVIMVAPSIHMNGHPYEIIGTKDPIVLTGLQALELKQHIDQVCIKNGVEYLTNTKTGERVKGKGSKGGSSRLGDNINRMIKKLTIDEKIEILVGQRNDMMIAVADSVLFNHSHIIPEEGLREYLDNINEKLCKPPLDRNELDGLWQRARRFVESTKEKEKEKAQQQQYDRTTTKIGEEDDSGIKLPDNPEQYGLHEDVCGVMNFTPPILAVPRSKTRQITKAKISNNNRTLGNTEYVTRSLAWISPIIDAIPLSVTRNENPLEENKISFTVIFTSKGLKRSFTIGPATITEIVEELTKRGRIIRRFEATDALTSIIIAYERKNEVHINDEIPTPGFYWRDGKIVGYHVPQRLDFDPWNNEQHRKEVAECIKIFDEWQDRNKKKTALPTSLKWTTLAPFAFITKTRSRDSDKWLPQFYPYDEADTGKTTLIEDAVLAPWGLYKDSENSHLNFKGPGSLDSPAKFGRAASQTTFPVLGDEIGNVFGDDNYSNMQDIQKYAVQNKYIRTVHGEDILALASFAYTSNAPPPRDGAARRRFVAMQFFKEEKWSDEEKKSYELWMNEAINANGESRKEKLRVYGDFVASYVIKHPEVIHYSSFLWYEPATKILKEFYKSAGIGTEIKIEETRIDTDVQLQLPSWLDLLQEQTVVQEAREQKHFELVGFLRHTIQEAYRMHNYVSPDPEAVAMRDSDDRVIERKLVTFERKVDYCLEQGFVPFLYKRERKNGETEIIITANIFHELKRYDSRNRNSSSNSSGYTLAALAAEIPGFEPRQRKINRENNKVVCGPKQRFYEFLNPTIEDTETESDQKMDE